MKNLKSKNKVTGKYKEEQQEGLLKKYMNLGKRSARKKELSYYN